MADFPWPYVLQQKIRGLQATRPNRDINEHRVLRINSVIACVLSLVRTKASQEPHHTTPQQQKQQGTNVAAIATHCFDDNISEDFAVFVIEVVDDEKISMIGNHKRTNRRRPRFAQTTQTSNATDLRTTTVSPNNQRHSFFEDFMHHAYLEITVTTMWNCTDIVSRKWGRRSPTLEGGRHHRGNETSSNTRWSSDDTIVYSYRGSSWRYCICWVSATGILEARTHTYTHTAVA